MRIECELLGTGTSYGVPAIGCSCPVCTSANPKNQRLRSSVVLRVTPKGQHTRVFLVDCTPDLRTQALRAQMKTLDAVLLTHEHADHTQGIDDLRAFYWNGGKRDIPLYCYPETLAAVRGRFAYMFDPEIEYKGLARLDVTTFDHAPFTASGIHIHPVPLVHGNMRVAAFRIADFAYITDTNLVPETSLKQLEGVKLLVIDALRRAPHPTHMSLPESIKVCERLGVERAFFTHINHDLDHDEINRELPKWASLGYDTLRVAVEGGRVEIIGDRL